MCAHMCKCMHACKHTCMDVCITYCHTADLGFKKCTRKGKKVQDNIGWEMQIKEDLIDAWLQKMLV